MAKNKPPRDWQDDKPLTDEMLADMRPLREVHPKLAEASRRFRGKQKTPTKQRVTMYFDADLVEAFKKDGKGWQTRMNDKLRAVVLGK
jgi:uncharacterized protein (DUF4415 family)